MWRRPRIIASFTPKAPGAPETPGGVAGQGMPTPELGLKPQVRPPILGGASIPGAGAVVTQPNLVPFQNSGAFQVTPVASPDRRWVRIGVSGSFNFVQPGPFVPVFTPVPTILQGPGRGLTVAPPFGLLRSQAAYAAAAPVPSTWSFTRRFQVTVEKSLVGATSGTSVIVQDGHQ